MNVNERYHVAELLDMLLSALTMPEYRGLREQCERELKALGILKAPPSEWLVRQLFNQYNR